MKLSLKSSSLFAAVAMSIYSVFIIIAQTPLYDNVILSVDKYFVLSYVCTSLLLVSMLVLGISIFINRKQIPVLSKSLIWQSMLSSLNDEQATELANRFDFSGGQIQNISRKQVINAIFSGKDELDYDQIKLDCQNESISRNSRGKVGF